MLQALEHMLDTVDQTSTLAGQLVNAQKSGKPLAPVTLNYYEQQLAELSTRREHMHRVMDADEGEPR